MSKHNSMKRTKTQPESGFSTRDQGESSKTTSRPSSVASMMSPAGWLLVSLASLGWLSLASLSMAASSPFDFSISGQESSSNQRPLLLRQLEQSQAQLRPTGELASSGSHQVAPTVSQFDATQYKSVQEALEAHPDLREFAKLCRADGAKEMLAQTKSQLSVFAPIDRATGQLMAKLRDRSVPINLVELARRHIAQELVTPSQMGDEQAGGSSTRATQSAAYLSPLFLNQRGHAHFVNNAKILATYLIQIEQFDGSPDYQALHVIDQVLDYSFVTRKTHLRGSTSSGGGGGGRSHTSTSKRALTLDDLLGGVAENELQEFSERFGDLQQASPLHSSRLYRSAQVGSERVALSGGELSLEWLAKQVRRLDQLRGRLFNTNESTAFNTYFLPVDPAQLAGGSADSLTPLLQAHILPDRALFTRQFELGAPEASLLNQSPAGGERVELSLAKSLPTSSQLTGGGAGELEQLEAALLASPLLVQARCVSAKNSPPPAQPTTEHCRPGLTSAELVLANIPLANGVLHLIRRPLVLPDASPLDFVNDDDRRLSQLVESVGSRTGSRPATVNKFRELLARERHVLASLTNESPSFTLLVPTDEAFAKLRYDLRALVERDDSLTPAHWGPAYRAEKLERLLRRHIVPHQLLTSDQLDQQQPLALASDDSGKMLTFRRDLEQPQQRQVLVRAHGDAYEAQLVHQDLVCSRGVVHLLDRVLGEEQESVWSLLKSNVALNKQQTTTGGEPLELLGQRVEQALLLRQRASDEPTAAAPAPVVDQSASSSNQPANAPEMAAIKQAVAQYLAEISPEQRATLASSVNISYQLARFTGSPVLTPTSATSSLASTSTGTSTGSSSPLDDWNERLKQADRMFTYFVPSDLAWIKLQQAQPELYRPLAYFLVDSSSSRSAAAAAGDKESSSSSQVAPNDDAGQEALRQRYAESSERLRQILERHLVINRKLGREELNKMDSIQTQGALLKLVQLNGTPPPQGHHQLTGVDSQKMSNSEALLSHQSNNNNNNNQRFSKGLRFYSTEANITQASEASNGYLYVIDNVLLIPEDSAYIVPASGANSAISSSVSSFLGARNTAILDFIHQVMLSSNVMANMSAQSLLTTIASLTCAIVILLVLAVALVVRRRRLSKLHNRHQHLESGLTSSASSNHSTGSTSTTKSL